MKNNKGFAVTGILYAILVLFLFFILLILNNFQARKVLFDKQKDTVLEKLGNSYEPVLERDYIYDSTKEFQEFITPKDGVYKIEVWGSGVNVTYVSGDVKLYQGIKLYILIGSTSSAGTSSNIRTEKLKTNSILINATGFDGSSSTFTYDKKYVDENGEISDIAIEPVDNVTILNGTVSKPSKSAEAGTYGYVKITFIGELNT